MEDHRHPGVALVYGYPLENRISVKFLAENIWFTSTAAMFDQKHSGNLIKGKIDFLTKYRTSWLRIPNIYINIWSHHYFPGIKKTNTLENTYFLVGFLATFAGGFGRFLGRFGGVFGVVRFVRGLGGLSVLRVGGHFPDFPRDSFGKMGLMGDDRSLAQSVCAHFLPFVQRIAPLPNTEVPYFHKNNPRIKFSAHIFMDGHLGTFSEK